MNKKNRKGFTIVELVIVIAVIGILATVLVPTFGTVIEDAKKSAVLQEAKNKYTTVYAADIADGVLGDKTSDGLAASGDFTFTKDGYTATFTASTGKWETAKAQG